MGVGGRKREPEGACEEGKETRTDVVRLQKPSPDGRSSEDTLRTRRPQAPAGGCAVWLVELRGRRRAREGRSPAPRPGDVSHSQPGLRSCARAGNGTGVTGAHTPASRSSLSTADRGDRNVQRPASRESCRVLTELTVKQRDSPQKATSTPRLGRPNRACLGHYRKVTRQVPLKRHLINSS